MGRTRSPHRTLPPTTGSPAKGWSTASASRSGQARWYRNRWVRSAEVAAALGEPPQARPGRRGHGLRLQHQRHRPCGPDLRHRGGGCAALRADRRAGNGRALRLRRAPCPAATPPTPNAIPDTGELHAVSYYWGWGNQVQYTVRRRRRAGPTDRGHRRSAGRSRSTTCRSPSSYAVIYDLPVALQRRRPSWRGASFPYRWSDDYQSTGRASSPRGRRRTTSSGATSSPATCSIPMNALRRGRCGGRSTWCRHPKMFATHLTGPDEGPPVLERWRIDPAAGKVVTATPRRPAAGVPPGRRAGGRTSAIVTATAPPSRTPGRTKRASTWAQSLHETRSDDRDRPRPEALEGGAGEAVFVPERTTSGEDEGFVLSLVYDPDRERQRPLRPPAQDFTGDPVAVRSICRSACRTASTATGRPTIAAP